jgi:drug/metabolite transporter (DMT)-like permease
VEKKKGMMFVLIGASFFGLNPIFAKTGFRFGFSIGQLTLAQMMFALIMVWGMTFMIRPEWKGLAGKDLGQLLMTGMFSGLTGIFYYGAIHYLTASLAIILLFQFVWIGFFYEWAFNKVKPSPASVVSIIVTLLGVLFASGLIGGNVGQLSMIGVVSGLLSAVTYAGFIFFSGKAAVNISWQLRTPFIVSGAAMIVMIVFIRDIPQIPLNDPRLWFVGVGLAMFGAVLSPLFFALGAYRIPGGLANILSSAELPVAIIGAKIVLSETVTLWQWFGIFLILAAIYVNESSLLAKRFRRPEEKIL